MVERATVLGLTKEERGDACDVGGGGVTTAVIGLVFVGLVVRGDTGAQDRCLD